MKRAVRAALIALVFAASASTAFAFEWISLSEPEAEMTVSASVGYGSLLIIPVSIFPAGFRFEMVIPGIDNLYAGAGLGYVGIEYDTDGDSFDYTMRYLSLSAYAKYIVFDRITMEDMIGMPLYVGAAAGVGYQFSLGDFALYDLSDDYGGLGGLAVALVGYELKRSTITAYVGLVDNTFGYSAEFNFRLNDSMHLGLFWVPLLGLGATFTMAL